MNHKKLWNSNKGSLRQRILASVGAMVLLSLLSSMVSLYKITEVNRHLEAINHVSVPLGRLFAQMQSDAEVFDRELERGLGYSHWKDPHWKVRPAPRWIEDVLENEMTRADDLMKSNSDWTQPEIRVQWQDWLKQVSQGLTAITAQAENLYSALEHQNEPLANEIYPKWTSSVDEWKRQLQWGVAEYERFLRQNFSTAENRVAELRTGMEVILIIVVLMSLLLLWLGERGLRPLAELTQLAREITRRGVRKEDKALFPQLPLTRSDEVSQLAREFHNMATALLEREKTVESQKNRLQEQNRLLRDIGELNENILKSIESILIVTDLDGKVTQCNPQALRWLEAHEEEVMGSDLFQWSKIQPLLENAPDRKRWLERFKVNAETSKLGPLSVCDRVYGGYLIPLRGEQKNAHGAILVLDDLTEEVDLQERLRRAENLAAIGRMSAQVAHEVRNPLHSIGLEAEIAAEMASSIGEPQLKQSLQSILGAVDRLQKITENYLKLSKLSDGQKTITDVGTVLESVLATYSTVCEVQGIQVTCQRESGSSLNVWADQDLLEQVCGNLFRNAIQALETKDFGKNELPQIHWKLGNTETGFLWLRIEDNGPGIAADVKNRLFVPFVTTRAQGTGLGLSFIKQVIDDHDGMIRNVEKQSGDGACFEILLPLLNQESNQIEKEEVVYAKDFVSG